MNNVMRYKEYWAKVQFSEADNCFWGEIEGINDSISFFLVNHDLIFVILSLLISLLAP